MTVNLNLSVVITMIHFSLTTLITMTMFEQSFVPKALYILVWTILAYGTYWLINQLTEPTKYKGVHRLFSMAIQINVLQFFSSFLYQTWGFSNVLSSGTVMKLIMIPTLIIIFIFTFALIQGDKREQRKTVNARIGEEEKPTFLQDLFSKKEEQAENDVRFILGVSRDKEQR